MCCLTQDPANPYTVTIVDCCTLKISNADGTLIDTFNLNDLDYQVANGILYLKDGVNTRTINVADAPAIFGVADIAAVLAFIDTAVTDCKCVTPPSVPVTLDVLNCDGTTTPTVFDQAPAKVEIVQTKPLVICKSSVDFEIGCSSVDGRTIVRTYVQDENGVITSQVFEQDGVTPVTDGSVLVKCGFDIEDVEFCYQDQTNAEIRYRQIVFVNAETSAVIGTIWLDGTGTAIAAPSNVEPCADADEIDLIYTNWLPICVDGVQWYVAEKLTFNNVSAIEGVAEKIYKQGADGAIVTTAPIGTVITEGVCKVEQPIPHTYGCIGTRGTDIVPNSFGFDLPNDFGTTNATDTYLHAVDDNVGGITYFYPPSVTNPTSPVIATNIAAIQSFLTSIGSGITYTINAFNEIVLTYATPGDENRWSFWMGTSNPDGYTNKLLPTLHDLRVDTVTYQQVQVVKYQESNGTYIDKFFIPSGDTGLTEVALAADQIFNFGNCPDCKKEIFATHDRFYRSTISNLQVWTLLSKYNDPHPDANLYGPTFTYIGDNVTGTHPSGPYSGNGINGWMVYSVLSTTQPIDDSNGHYWILGQPDSFGTFTFNRINANLLAPENISCIAIQEIKEKDSCTGEETYRYIIEDGTGKLVPASDVIVGFDEANVLIKCPEYKIYEKEVCGTIDGSTDVYELVKIYTRDNKGVQSLLHYEDKFGNQITGAVVETCCTCDSLCTVAPPAPPLSDAVAYAKGITGQYGCGDKFGLNLDIQWQVKVYKDGTLVHNSPVSPILTSEAAALTWLNSNSGGHWLNTNAIPWTNANSTNTYQFVSPSVPEEYLMIVTETTNSNIYCGSAAVSPFRYAFTNRGISYGASCDNADAFAWSDLWADRTGWYWVC